MDRMRPLLNVIFPLLIISALSLSLLAHPILVVLSNEDLKDAVEDDAPASDGEWDDLGAFDMKPDYEFDPGSWTPFFDDDDDRQTSETPNSIYYSALSKMIASVSAGDPRAADEASSHIEAAALAGNPHAQSVLGFLYSTGLMRARDGAKALLE
uniref:Sel1 repeat family protein n=1 Tax=Kalanchoe fedtschenkoi TaxID=63787 RepID=A0A7N0RBQ0_KALFE